MFNFQDTKPVRTQSENSSSDSGVSTPWENYLFTQGSRRIQLSRYKGP